MKRSFRRLAASLASCGLILTATSVFAQALPPIPPVPVTRSGPGGSANPILPDPTAQSPASQRQTVVGAPSPAAAVAPAPLPEVVAKTVVTAVGLDREIATSIALAHREQAQFASIARDKSLASNVKLLATEIFDDHTRALADLDALYPLALTPVETVRTDVAVVPGRPVQPARPDGTMPPTSTIRPALPLASQVVAQDVVVATPSTMVELRRRIADQSLTLAQRKLIEKQGAEFDATYVGMTLVKHQELYAMLHASRDLASPELRRLIDAQMQFVGRHLSQAERLMPEVASRAYVAQTPGAVAR